MSELTLRGVTAGYGRDAVLQDVDLTVAAGTTTAVLGGSGNGKTTLLRVVAGFLAPRSGEVRIGGRAVAGPGTWVPPERRGVGYVRQEGGLFPHLTVAANVAFGLPWPRRRHRARVLELLELVGLPAEAADRRPDQLSGGQQQRVALARALAPRPELVLLDEPFSSLDTALRAATREATARALKATGATAVLVTHDQGEALSFADEVAILDGGRFRQVARPREAYGDPADAGVAAFLGDAVFVSGTVSGGRLRCALGDLPVRGTAADGPVQAMIRPEQITVAPSGTTPCEATVREVEYFGHDAIVELDLPGDAATVPGVAAADGLPEELPEPVDGVRARLLGRDLPLPGDRVAISVVGEVRVFPRPGTAVGLPSPKAGHAAAGLQRAG
ncbi:ABC transporter ATP-binding protein [Citricoccus sp. SGAir0253]|uniref:ABC transporter ATP-binding protein n=1 Tax=Citricoccus sp. SGAir0253 TaxID=2567881 RepID=UPI0010CD1B80|nr:ABC transporter ATP-binding protein [Citricoccus sp. SGAir0253]QCU78242.1 ABC transporter ATP-binding protein [Citricoccus sp. SGAir0253]